MQFRLHDIWQQSFIHTHLLPCSQCSSIAIWNLCMKFMNISEAWQWGYGLVHFLTWYSFLCWPPWGTSKTTMSLFWYHLEANFGGEHLHGDSWTIQVPPLCNGPPSIFGAWAASTHGRLPGTIQWWFSWPNAYVSTFPTWQLWILEIASDSLSHQCVCSTRESSGNMDL